jgi:hypothetical protein
MGLDMVLNEVSLIDAANDISTAKQLMSELYKTIETFISIAATSESEATLNQYRHTRTFICPDGVPQVFKWHVRLTPGAWRIHFFPLDDKRQLIIGYIGRHLPIATS